MDAFLAMDLPPTATDVTDIPSCEQRQFQSVEHAADAAMVEVLNEDFDADLDAELSAFLDLVESVS